MNQPCTAHHLRLTLLAVTAAAASLAQPNVTTQHNDNSRTGAYLGETLLTPASVSSGRFGALYERETLGDVLAQPLYIRGVPTSRGPKNLIFIATALNNLYAYDADDLSPGLTSGRVWMRNLCGSFDVNICDETKSHRVGITSTPVIDVATQTMYVVARCSFTNGGPDAGGPSNSDNYLYAINLSDGSDRHPRRKIEAVDPADSRVAFDARCQRNRPGLLLMNGVIFMAFGTFSCDGNCPGAPYHGWVLAYRASDLTQVGVFNTSTRGGAAGIWQSGNGLVGGPDGSIYFETGNDAPVAPLGDSFVKLRLTSAGLSLAGSFTPNNTATLRNGDTDLGSGGPLLLPGNRLIGGGKQGRFYVLDANTMRITQNCDAGAGHCSPGVSVSSTGDGFLGFLNTWHNDPSRPACAAAGGAAGCNLRVPTADCYIAPSRYDQGELCGPNIHAGPIFWKPSSLPHALIYHMPEKDYLKAFAYDQASGHVTESAAVTATGSWARQPDDGMPGGASSISANGGVNGIVWTTLPTVNGQWNNAIGRLAAFDALSLRQIWVDGDAVNYAKFNAPTVADGKVIRATFSDKMVVYGMRGFGYPIWRYTGIPCTGDSCPGWQKLDNNSKTVMIASGGNQLYQLHNDGWIWRYTGTACTGDSCPGWQRLDNNSKTVAIAAGNQLYQLQNDGWIWRYTGTPCTGDSCPGWQRLDRNSKTVAIAASGDQLYQLHNDGWIWRFTGAPCAGESCPGWQRLDRNSKTVAIAAAGGQLYQLHNDGWIWRYTGTPCAGESCPGWQRLDNNSKAIAIAAGGGQLYQLHNDGWVWRYTGTPCSGDSCPGWQRLDNNSKTIAIAAASDGLYQLHNDGWIWRSTGAPCAGESCPGWQRLDNNSSTGSISAGDQLNQFHARGQLFQLHGNGWIWRYTGLPCNGDVCQGWQRLDNNANTWTITATGSQLFQLHKNGWIWRYTGTPCAGDSCPGWQRLDNNGNTKAIVAAGNQLFQLHKTGWIWRYTGTPCTGESCPGWQRLDNNENTASIAAGGNQLYQLHKNGWIFRYTGTPCDGDSCPGWQRLDNNPNTIAIVAAGNELFQLHKSGWIWRYTGTPCTGDSCPGWQRLDDNPNTIAISAAGTQLFQLHKTGWIWRYTGTPCTGDSCPGWQRLDNNPNTALFASAGAGLYQLHKTGLIWTYTGTPCTGESCPGWRMLDNNPNTKLIVVGDVQK